MNDQYFEAILQLRNPSEEAIFFIADRLREHVSRIDNVTNGYDIYIQDKRVGRRVAKQTQQEFGGEMNVSSTLHTRDHQTSKELYRDTVLIRLPDFQQGDFIRIDGEVYEVTGIGKQVSLRDIRSDKRSVRDYPEQFEHVEPEQTRVVQNKPHVEVLHPETYQAVELQNSRDDLQVQEKIDVIDHKGLWLV